MERTVLKEGLSIMTFDKSRPCGRIPDCKKTFCVKLLVTLLLVSGLAPGQSVWAHEDLTTGELEVDALYFDLIPSVFGASKYEQKITEAPATVSVVTAEEIARYGYRTIGEILASLPGLYMTNDRNYGYLGIRGFSKPGDFNSRILVLVDGQRYDDSIYLSTGTLTDFPVDVDLIERLEFIRGPGSALYGSAALLGVVNIMTKRGRDISGFETSAEYGSFDTYKIRGSYGTRLDNGLEILLSATKYDSDGQDSLYYLEFDDPSTNNGIYEDNDDDSFESFKAKIGYQNYTFDAAWSSRDKRIPTASYGTVFNDDRAYTNDEYLILGLTYASTWADRLDVTGTLGYTKYDYVGDYPYDWPPVVLNHDVAYANSIGGEFSIGYVLNEQHHLLLGVEGRNAFRQDQLNFDKTPDGPLIYLDDKRSSNNWGVFLQDDITVTPKLNAMLGLRYDNYTAFGGSFSPRVALVYNLPDRFTLKALYGEAFRVPNSYELYFNDDYVTTKPSENLQPEQTQSYELVLEYRFTPSLGGSVSLYKYYVDDVIVLVTDPEDDLLQTQNGATQDIKGLELVLEGRGPWGTEGRLSYAYNDGHDEITKAEPVNSPRHSAKLNFGFPILAEKLSGGAELQYESRRKLLKDGWSRSSLVANLGMETGSFLGSWKISFHVYNVFDTVIEHPGGEEHVQRVIEQNGRSFRLKLVGTF